MKQSIFLPQELWAEIIGLCSRDDVASLALTHIFFTPTCTENLFRNITITDWRLRKLLPRLDGLSSPRIAAHIQTLRLAIALWKCTPTAVDPAPPRSIQETNAWISAVSPNFLHALGEMINLREYVHGDVRIGSCIYPFTDRLVASLSNLSRLKRFHIYGDNGDALRTAVIRNLEEVSMTLAMGEVGEIIYPFLSHSHATLRKVTCEVETVLGDADSPDYTRFLSFLRSAPRLEYLDATFLFEPDTVIDISLDVSQFDRGQEIIRRWMRELRKDMTALPNLRKLLLTVVTPDIYLKDWPALLSGFVAGRNLEALVFNWSGHTKYLPDAANILDPLDDLTALAELAFPIPDHEDFVAVIAAISRKAPNLRKLELWNSASSEGHPRCSKAELKQKAPRLSAELCHFKNLDWLIMSEPMPSGEVMLDYARVLGSVAPKLRQVSFCGRHECRFIRDGNGRIIDVLDMSGQ